MARRLTRRSLLKAGLTAGAALTAPTILVRKASAQTEKTLKVVQWKHFVPDYDRYFNQFAKEFGEKHKCTVEVDYVATPDLPTSIAADISRGGGHDVFHSKLVAEPREGVADGSEDGVLVGGPAGHGA